MEASRPVAGAGESQEYAELNGVRDGGTRNSSRVLKSSDFSRVSDGGRFDGGCRLPYDENSVRIESTTETQSHREVRLYKIGFWLSSVSLCLGGE